MKVDRLVSMIMILLEKWRVGAQEMTAMFEVSPRTVYRDMEAINQAGISRGIWTRSRRRCSKAGCFPSPTRTVTKPHG